MRSIIRSFRSILACLLLIACKGSSAPPVIPTNATPVATTPEPPQPADPVEPPKPVEPPANASVTGNLPEVAHGFAPLTASVPAIVVTPTGIVIEGQAILAISNGAVDPAELEGGAQGIRVPRLTKFLETLFALPKANKADGVALVLDKQLPYRLLITVMFSAKQAGITKFHLLARSNGAIVAAPIVLPAPPDPKAAPSLKMFVSLTKDKILLWSASGQEGTLRKPKLEAKRGELAKLVAATAEIVQRRWASAKRSEADRTIVIQADSTVTIHEVVEVITAVRSTPDGKELFPDIAFASGFD